MLAVLPFLAFALLTLGFRQRNSGWRESFLFASIPCALFVALSTEALSPLHWVTRPILALAWLGFALGCLLWGLRRAKGEGQDQPESEERRQPLSPSRSPLELSARIGLYGIAAIALLTLITALVSAPNTWDAMEYHLPRVVEWISNRGVQLYPTIDRQQLYMPSFAEYTMLHLDLLYGSDRLVNLVQWFSSVGCILAVSLIARMLGGDLRAQIFAAVLAATVPAGILGASSAKNDYVLTYWIVLAVYFLLRWKNRQQWPDTLAIAATLSLAVFTKGTAYVFLPFLVLACMAAWDGAAMRRFLRRLPVLVFALFLINAPLWARNFRFSGSILGLSYFDGAGPVSGRIFANSHITVTRTLANLLRSIGLNVGVPSHRINAITTHILSGGISLLGVNPNDPGQIVIGQSGLFRPFAVTFASRNEALSGNTLHFLLFVAALVCCLGAFRKLKREVVWLALGLVGAFVLYSAMLRWSPFNARYQLPIFVLSAVVVALVFTRVLHKGWIAAITVLALVASLPPAIANQIRPLLTKSGLKGSILTTPRDETYFFDSHQGVASSFIAAARAVAASRCKSVGVDANGLHYEYPLFALLTEYGGQEKISYVGVENSTARYKPKTAQPPCAIICLQCLEAPDKIAKYAGGQRAATTYGDVVVFTPENNRISIASASDKK